MHFCRFFPALVVSLILSATCLAEVVVLDVVIESADAEKSQITATRKGKTLQLDVSDNVAVIMKGRSHDLSVLGARQPAKISYETALRVVTKIEVTGDPQPEMNLLVLKEICTPGNETGPWLSADGLRIHWHVRDGQISWIWTANRQTPAGVFSDARRLLPGSDATLTADELRMILLQDGKLCSTQRKSVGDQFERPTPISELAVFDLVAPCLSADGLTLYADQGTGQSRRICQIERSSLDSPWGEPRLLYGTEDHEIKTPFVSADGKLLLASTRGEPFVKVFKRDDASEPFTYVGYAGTGALSVKGRFPRYCQFTKELFVAITPDGKSDTELGVIGNYDPSSIIQSVDPDVNALPSLEGNWVAVGEENDGKMMDKKTLREANKKLIVNGDRFLLSWSGMTIRGELQMNGEARPIELDLSGKLNGRDVVLRAIVEINGDKMRMCYRSEIAGAREVERPSTFATQPGSGSPCVYYQRQSP